MQNPIKRIPMPEIFLLLVIITVGVMYVRFTWLRIENEQSDKVLRIAQSLEAMLPKEDILALEATPADIEKPQYQIIKNALKAIILVNPEARFAYIYTKQNGKLYFFADSEPDDSKECSPPGQEYTEADSVYYQPFKDGENLITAHVTDRWGTWRSVLIPVKDEATGKTIATFAMDFNAKSWENFLLYEVIESSILILIMFIAILFLFKIKVKNKSLNYEIIERKQAENALLDSENQKAAILKAIPDLLFVFNQNGEYLEVYTEDDSKLMVPRELLIGKNISDLFSRDIADKAIAAIRQSLQSKKLVQFYYSTDITGKVEYFEARIVPASETKVLTIVRDITQSKEADEALLQSQERARRQRNAIARIAEDEVISFGEIAGSFERLTEEIATAVQVERASIWLFSDDKTMLRCVALFENKTKKHSSGAILRYADYPHYFKAIGLESRISADDAQNDPRTSEFTADYLLPLGITSMLDAGIQLQGELTGVVCLEHTAEKRTWYSDEESFASTIASIVAQSLANNKRKLTEAELEESREKYRGLCEAAFEAIFISEKGRCIEQNLTAEKVFGYTTEEALGRLGTEWIVPENRELVMHNILTGYEEPYEATALKKDGSTFPCILRGKMMYYKGKYVRVTSLTDITDLKKVEEALRTKDWAIESAISAIAISDLAGNLDYVNPAFLKLWGYSAPEEVLWKSPEGFWKLCESMIEIKETLFSVGSWSGEMVARHKEGSPFDVQVEASVILDAKGQPHSLLASFADITERKKMISSLENALAKAESGDRLKTAFMNNISHEVRTPLNGILGFCNLIAQPDASYDEKVMYNSHLETSSNRLMSTITNYMDISLIASGNMEVSRKSINLQTIMYQLFIQFQPLCALKNLELHLEIPPPTELFTLNSDEELFMKIMSHLLDNAIKFTSQGEVTFGYAQKRSKTTMGTTGSTSPADSPPKPANEHAELTETEFFVKDTGIGIKEEALSVIFDSFNQEELSRSRGYEGSGLGLSIALGLVQLLGGEMQVTSSKEAGSTFLFTLPNNEIPDRVNPAKRVLQQALPGKPVILIAEDDESNLFFLEVILKQKNIEVLLAANGKEAVDQCRKHPEISLVLMDIKMPVMDGLQATREIKSFRKELPVIACTAFALSGDTKMAREAGCDDYVAKPFRKEKLLGQLKKYGVMV